MVLPCHQCGIGNDYLATACEVYGRARGHTVDVAEARTSDTAAGTRGFEASRRNAQAGSTSTSTRGGAGTSLAGFPSDAPGYGHNAYPATSPYGHAASSRTSNKSQCGVPASPASLTSMAGSMNPFSPSPQNPSQNPSHQGASAQAALASAYTHTIGSSAEGSSLRPIADKRHNDKDNNGNGGNDLHNRPKRN